MFIVRSGDPLGGRKVSVQHVVEGAEAVIFVIIKIAGLGGGVNGMRWRDSEKAIER